MVASLFFVCSAAGVGGDDELDAEPLASPLDEASPDDLLYPIDRIEKYHNSEELFDRLFRVLSLFVLSLCVLVFCVLMFSVLVFCVLMFCVLCCFFHSLYSHASIALLGNEHD